MKPLRQMTRAELIRCIQTLEQGAPTTSIAFEHERLLHELQVHQIELDMQNRDLREAQRLLELSRDRYADLYDFAPVGYVTLDKHGVIHELNLTATRLLGCERSRLVGVPFHLHVAREDLARFRAHLQSLSAERDTVELRLIQKQGAPIPVMMHSVLVQHPASKQRLCRTTLTDITARLQVETALRASLIREQARATELAALLDAVPTPVFIAHDPDCRQVTTNRAADELLRSQAAPSASGGPGSSHYRAMREGRELSPEELPIQRAARGSPVQNFEFSLILADGGMREVLGFATPLLDADGRSRGAVHVLVDITERKRLEREILAITEREQRNFGHDLHDGLGQRLTGLEMLSNALAEDLRGHTPAVSELARRLNGELRATVTQARLLSHSLAPVPLEGEGLMQGLRELAAATSRIPGVKCRFTCDPPVQIPDTALATHLYRIAQEAVNNALKHGQASKVDIVLTERAQKMVLSVENNGHPFPALKPASQGLGLNAMRYRAEMIGAELFIGPGRRKRVRVACTLTR